MFIIEKLDGFQFSQMMISGSNKLYNNRQRINDLNVFPVPDGDTGTNMSMTAAAVSEALIKNKPTSVTKAAEIMSYAALRGARGNSGVILSQLFRGMEKSLKSKLEITPTELAAALGAGAKAAYRAVMTPTEGTILTVAREAAQGALNAAETAEKAADILAGAVDHGNNALKNTINLLPSLQDAGVVDAGGAGCMLILEGALEYLNTGTVVKKENFENLGEHVPENITTTHTNTIDIKFQYCTEFIIEKSKRNANVDLFRSAITPKGDCVLIIDDDDAVKVHIHTNHPGIVIEAALKVGEITNLKVDNMKRQHNELITKSAVKNPEKTSTPMKTYGFAAVASGHGMTAILSDLGIDRVIDGGRYMNPSTRDILKAVSKIKAKTVYVFPNNKNTVMAAEQAARLTEDKRVVVIKTTSIPQCISAVTAFNSRNNSEENERRMNAAAKYVKTGQITYAAKDTNIHGNSVKKGDILGIDEEGIRYIGSNAVGVLEQMIAGYIKDNAEYIMVYVGRDVKRQDIEKTAKKLTEHYEDTEILFRRGGQPVYYYTVSAE